MDKGLRGLLAAAGIDLVRDNVTIAPVPGSIGAGVNFGVTAAKALEERKIDGFWANGMSAFARTQNILDDELVYENVVVTQFSLLWKA